MSNIVPRPFRRSTADLGRVSPLVVAFTLNQTLARSPKSPFNACVKTSIMIVGVSDGLIGGARARGGTLGSKNGVMQLGLSIAIVGVRDGKGRGKMTYDYFLPPFERTLAALDRKVRHYSYGDFIFSRHRDDAAILLYSEVRSQKNPAFLQMIEDAEVAARARNTVLVNASAIGKLIADKSSTNRVLAAGGKG